MKGLTEFNQIYLFTEFMDMRKDINALSALASYELKADWSQPQLFVFMGKTKKLIKILYYDKTGFALWKKRLEEDRFSWFKNKNNGDFNLVKTLTTSDLKMVLEGVNIFSKHEEKTYSVIA